MIWAYIPIKTYIPHYNIFLTVRHWDTERASFGTNLCLKPEENDPICSLLDFLKLLLQVHSQPVMSYRSCTIPLVLELYL